MRVEIYPSSVGAGFLMEIKQSSFTYFLKGASFLPSELKFSPQQGSGTFQFGQRHSTQMYTLSELTLSGLEVRKVRNRVIYDIHSLTFYKEADSPHTISIGYLMEQEKTTRKKPYM
ncbi:hypothetical protein [Shimazuella alba]|uniref:Uncharacterized protein n=1 Tax=Shimazuella alba TaxID=2690964 RepID=A0A6I4VSG8_9BACL|nr:hypothetical protein [Shimazuella alba]MXQ54527.1 hypothetical protein [Shimazuella alba]